MNKRRHQRIEVQNLVANLSNGVDSFAGTVNDVSPDGMLLTNISQEFDSQEATMSIVVSTKGQDLKMLVVPKWVSGKNSAQKIGLAILDAPLAWNVFVMNYEPAADDIWAATTNLPDY